MTDEFKKGIAKRLKDLREEKELTQSGLAQVLKPIYDTFSNGQADKKLFSEDNGKGTISSLENYNRAITVDIALAYSEYFKVSLDYIFGKDDSWQKGYTYINEVVGIEDVAIDKLARIKRSKDYFDLDILSYLIEEDYIQKFLVEIREAVLQIALFNMGYDDNEADNVHMANTTNEMAWKMSQYISGELNTIVMNLLKKHSKALGNLSKEKIDELEEIKNELMERWTKIIEGFRESDKK